MNRDKTASWAPHALRMHAAMMHSYRFQHVVRLSEQASTFGSDDQE